MPYLIQLNSHSPQVSHHSVNHPPTSQLSTKSVQILFFDLAKVTHCKLVVIVIIHDDGLLMNKNTNTKTRQFNLQGQYFTRAADDNILYPTINEFFAATAQTGLL